jgi:hypothetical protein
MFSMEHLTPRRQGDIGEMSAAYWLASKEAGVYMPFGHSPDVDLIATIDGEVIRIQVKTATSRHGPSGYQVKLSTSGGNQSWNRVIKRFSPDRFDYLFVLVSDGRRWFIPSTAIEGSHCIVLGGAKYAEFEIERGDPIRSAGKRAEASPLTLLPQPGGAPESGEPGAAVNRVPRAEGVRIPPPPSRRFIGRFERTRISIKHQVTIPRDAFIPAGLEVGDKLRATCTGPGRVVLERIDEERERLTLLDDIA